MSAPTDARVEPRPETEAREITPVRRLYWSVRRELWEYRSVYLAPLAVAAVFLVGFLVSLVRLPQRLDAARALGPIEQQAAVEPPYVLVAIMLMAVALLVAVFYCLDALYGERRDRSVLFWRSLPVSDRTAVLAKASIPILVLPLVTFAVTVVTHFIMLLASGAVLMASGTSAQPLWTHVPFLETAGIQFFHLVAFHGLWYAPFYGWLLMVSAWAKRAPFLWATLPPVALGAVERIAFGTSNFAGMLRDRFTGGPDPTAPEGPMTMDMLGASDSIGSFLAEAGLWVGLAVTAAFLLATVRLRRSRGAV